MLAVISLFSSAVLVAAPVAAQQDRAAIRCTIVHADGSVAAGVPLTVTSEDTGESRLVLSAHDGIVTVASLPPGTYRLQTSAGFEPATVVRTHLAPGEALDVEMRLGLTSISVEADVRPTFVRIDRHSPTSRTRIDATFIHSLPLDGRDLADLVLLAPGTSTDDPAIASNGKTGSFTSFYIDGTYNTEPRSGTPVANLPLDAIGEIDIRTAGFDVSHGRSAGAQVLATSKSGTNRLAGGATGFLRTHPGRAQLGGFAGGPLAVDRTFLFGSYQFTEAPDGPVDPDRGHVLAGRADHIFSGPARLTAHYALDDGRPFDRRGQSAGASFHTVAGSAFTNEVRLGLARVGFGSLADDRADAEFSSYHVANVVTWSDSMHLVSAGAEWYGLQHGHAPSELSASNLGLFVQDDWRAFPSISITGGVRFDRTMPDEADASGTVSPRVGASWTVDPEGHTVVRAAYGIYRNLAPVEAVSPKVDEWSVSVQRQIGRARSLEATYIGNRGNDLFDGRGKSRYDAMQLEFEQRNDLGITTLVGYTYGKWTNTFDFDEVDLRSPLDSRHRVTAALVLSLPFGDERLLFSDGLAARVLGNMELTGLFTFQSGRPSLLDQEGPGHRNIDLGLLKTLVVDDMTLQLRAEMFNVTDRVNLGRGRRFQFGGRILF